jgi:sugar phosphate isomerase/epimerase
VTAFSYQLYSSRNFPPLSATLAMLKRLGYAAVEGYGALYADPAKVDELREHLVASGLAMPTAHFSLDMIEKEPGRVVGIASSLGIGTVYCPYLLPEHRPDSGSGWEAFGRRLQAAGRPLREAGLGFGWHNHAFEFERTADGAIPQQAILESGPDLEWEADIAWVIKGGADPFAWIASHGARITAVHVKDIAPAGTNADEDGWADVGSGTVDWPAVMAALKATPARHFIMEHDNPKDHERFAARSIAAASAF